MFGMPSVLSGFEEEVGPFQVVEEEEDNLYPLEEVRLEDSCHLDNLNPLEEVESEGQYQRVEVAEVGGPVPDIPT